MTKKHWQSAGKLVFFFLGIVVTIVFGQWFVSMLPGPVAELTMSELRPQTGPGVGCLEYVFTFRSSDAIQYSAVKLMLPYKVTGFKVSHTATETIGSNPSGMSGFELGRNVNGVCDVLQSAGAPRPDSDAYAAGNTLSFHTEDLPKDEGVEGAIATDNHTSSVTPRPQDITVGGRYRYLKLNFSVEREVAFRNMGFVDSQPPTPDVPR